MLLTTSSSVSIENEEYVKAVASRHNWLYVPRRTDSLAQVRSKYGPDESLLVYGNNQWRWYPHPHSDGIFFHPSMAHVRLKRLIRGERDLMLELAGVTEGDSVLDCTAGMASDSIVFSHAVGASGRTVALEWSEGLAFLVHEGLATYRTEFTAVEHAMRRIELRRAHHLDILRSLPDRSFDIVYFDPMFRKPVADSNVIAPLRTVVLPDALALESIHQACRVARRVVMLKEHRGSAEFARLGFTRVHHGSGKIAYGVIDC